MLVPIFNDTLVEGTETFLFNLSNPQGGAALGSPTQATVSIVDNDQGGAIQFSARDVLDDRAAGGDLDGLDHAHSDRHQSGERRQRPVRHQQRHRHRRHRLHGDGDHAGLRRR